MKELLINGSEKLGIPLDGEQIDSLINYADILREWNEKINLTAITDNKGIAVKHFLDSLTVFGTGCVKGKVIDVGTGAGFPGLVLKIAKTEIELTLIDSLQKRINFLNDVCARLEIKDVETVHTRAEDGGRNRLYRGQFDTVVSRAVARLSVLSEWCMPFLKQGGYFLALKGPLADEELNDARRAIKILGGRLEDVFEADIPFTDLKHKIIIIKKVGQTPLKYPRKAGIATKTPIGTCYNLSK
ncbi:16S rRNA (guanine(527)-N(7))-methyltransferase RsmG [Lachnospiraceae bacterium MD329]|nr:16S rRNA (guanine(527)-N(7))-methyltransferase RsmG [Lachnospiraceae bacterium MD329]